MRILAVFIAAAALAACDTYEEPAGNDVNVVIVENGVSP